MSRAFVWRLVVALIATAAAIAVCWFAWWWTHPTLLAGPRGGEVGMDHPLSLARAHVTAGVIDPPVSGSGATIELRSAHANFATGSAIATVSFAVCHGSQIGLVTDLSPECQVLRDLPATFHYVPGSNESLVMTVRATAPGEIKIESVSVDYRHGADEVWQQGSETIRRASVLSPDKRQIRVLF